MKKLLFQFDTDPRPSAFDTIVAYDGGADHVIGHGGLTPDTIAPLVEGTIFTRAPKDKKNTAIFVGGSDMLAGQQLFSAVQKHFFPGFQVSIMLDSNGSNTTAAAGVAKLASTSELSGKKAVVLAGTGPVGQRVAVMLAQEGCEVSLTSREMIRAEHACLTMRERFGVELTPIEAVDQDARGRAIENAQIVFAAGAAGVELLKAEHWQNNDRLELLADANATPPIGIGGIDMMDKGNERHGKIVWGAIGFGAFKLALHRACIAKLFETNTQVLDAEQIFAFAKEMA
ncbi:MULTISPECIES: NADP-dependent methylenetetrahydromethanopterin/methylenetetrahydrofolate dehydrogenase [Methylotuvimicrobium]|uniref:Bifunctional protein mdtA [NADP-dependent methylenetetrahydromethanopterin dehydrogenase Methylenetetrahydrofolate dehydrogenase] n=2 Tax=Methylotuvimicrobium TaxID=2822410 RepID=G4T3T0_META2|nr:MULTISPECIES: NADP-dependent methylenetetrahydromethanopterin/methylenetetrahydrofolate dehydrogenase [Methylotuvimicrobium]QCW81602.1 methylenetetrahydrofolate dehydrogenase [Methylotuvimicrobium buryatense]CCE24886.1 Bifunctional protein mdtA [NADP-dependent methylenetetrahydromethanopterin dehydrogenase; Methylenetetrahydrofolate dehydrogenase] [Methylotuvimicrobium alcaliphilum 20Z]